MRNGLDGSSVLAKGIPQKALRPAHIQKEKLLKDVQKNNTTDIVRSVPRTPPDAQFTTVLLGRQISRQRTRSAGTICSAKLKCSNANPIIQT